jgi:uncharacterized membrane protein HdeD (DUF308 family)
MVKTKGKTMKGIWAGAWWAVLLRGLVAILFGVGALSWPDVTVAALALLYTPYAVVDGAILVSLSIQDRRVNKCCWAGFAHGVLSIVAGITAIVWPGLTVFPLLIIVASRAAVGGLLEIITAVQLRQEIKGESLLVLSGILSIIVAVLLLANPGVHITGLASGIGAYAVLVGLMLALLAFNLRGMSRRIEEQPAGLDHIRSQSQNS